MIPQLILLGERILKYNENKNESIKYTMQLKCQYFLIIAFYISTTDSFIVKLYIFEVIPTQNVLIYERYLSIIALDFLFP